MDNLFLGQLSARSSAAALAILFPLNGDIPDAIHEHTTITASTVVLIVLIILAILALCIWKKFGVLKEQIGTALIIIQNVASAPDNIFMT